MITAQKLRPETRFTVSGMAGVFLKSHDVGNTTFAKTLFGNSPEDAGKIVEIDGSSPCFIIPTVQQRQPSTKAANGNREPKQQRKPKVPSEYLVLSVVHEDKGELVHIEHPTALKLAAFSGADIIRISEGPNKGEYNVEQSAFDVDENKFYIAVS